MKIRQPTHQVHQAKHQVHHSILLKNTNLRCLVARQFLSQIYALFWCTIFKGLKMRWCTKKDKYKVCKSVKYFQQFVAVLCTVQHIYVFDQQRWLWKQFCLYRGPLSSQLKQIKTSTLSSPIMLCLPSHLDAGLCANQTADWWKWRCLAYFSDKVGFALFAE